MKSLFPTLQQSYFSVSSQPDTGYTPLFLARVPAGFPSPADDYIEEGLDLNTYLIRRPASTFMFQVVGDSMTGAGIIEGDKVVVDRSITPKNGHIVVAVMGGDYTLKRLFKTRTCIELHAANPKYSPIAFNESSDLQIWGVVVGAVRRYTAIS